MGFASYGDHWRNLRRLTTLELFSSNRLALFTRIREEEVQLLVKQLFEECKGQLVSKVDLRPRLVELSFNIMLGMISGKRYYGKDAVAQEGKEFQILIKEFAELQGSGNLNDFFPILRWVDFQGLEKRMVKLMNKMDSFFQKLLDEHRRNKSMSAANKQKNMTTLIDVMLDLQQTEPEFYTQETVKGVILANAKDKRMKVITYKTCWKSPLDTQRSRASAWSFFVTPALKRANDRIVLILMAQRLGAGETALRRWHQGKIWLLVTQRSGTGCITEQISKIINRKLRQFATHSNRQDNSILIWCGCIKA